MFRTPVPLCWMLPAVSNLTWAADAARTIIWIRHAEKADVSGDDAPLSKPGQCRAEVLASMLADSGVKQIYTTRFIRTKQTAQPLAKTLGIQPYDKSSQDEATLVAKLRSEPAAGTVLVVGHSNSAPSIISRLGAGKVTPIDDKTGFDRMFVVTLTGAKQAEVAALRYPGCPDPK